MPDFPVPRYDLDLPTQIPNLRPALPENSGLPPILTDPSKFAFFSTFVAGVVALATEAEAALFEARFLQKFFGINKLGLKPSINLGFLGWAAPAPLGFVPSEWWGLSPDWANFNWSTVAEAAAGERNSILLDNGQVIARADRRLKEYAIRLGEYEKRDMQGIVNFFRDVVGFTQRGHAPVDDQFHGNQVSPLPIQGQIELVPDPPVGKIEIVFTDEPFTTVEGFFGPPVEKHDP